MKDSAKLVKTRISRPNPKSGISDLEIKIFIAGFGHHGLVFGEGEYE